MNINVGQLKKFLANCPDSTEVRLVIYLPGYVYNFNAVAFGGLLPARGGQQELHLLAGPNLPALPDHLFNLQSIPNESQLSDSSNNNTAGQPNPGPEVSRYQKSGTLFD
jgi:hypothetical protein